IREKTCVKRAATARDKSILNLKAKIKIIVK
ncbi:unnamed protein product, partial [marine sediment metagenome]